MTVPIDITKHAADLPVWPLCLALLSCVGCWGNRDVSDLDDIDNADAEAVSIVCDVHPAASPAAASPDQQWEGFAVGSWVEWEEIGELEGEVLLHRTVRFTLQEPNDDGPTVERTIQDVEAEPRTEIKPLTLLKLPEDLDLSRAGLWTEELEIAGQALTCRVEEYQGETEKATHLLRTWSADEVQLPPRSLPLGTLGPQSLALSPHVVRATYDVTGKDYAGLISVELEVDQWQHDLTIGETTISTVADKLSLIISSGPVTDVTRYWCAAVPGRLVKRISTTDFGGHQTQTFTMMLIDYEAKHE